MNGTRRRSAAAQAQDEDLETREHRRAGDADRCASGERAAGRDAVKRANDRAADGDPHETPKVGAKTHPAALAKLDAAHVSPGGACAAMT
jgi:hypothetical protein